MSYVFPPSLYPLRDYLRSLGADTIAFVSARQAAYMAQKLLDTRVKFPSKGEDMTSTLFLIQKAIPANAAAKPVSVPERNGTANTDKSSSAVPARSAAKRSKRGVHTVVHEKVNDIPDTSFGVHIFCDGAAVPNPGIGGWGVVVYIDGDEINSRYGGEAETTNNRMEMNGLLVAIEEAWKDVAERGPVTIWCDSQYCVNGVNEWRHKWKRNGWKKSPNSPDHVKNVELWKEIDAALLDVPLGHIQVRWVKGHAGIAGNERADELAEMGRQEACETESRCRDGGRRAVADDLDAAYRAIMGAP